MASSSASTRNILDVDNDEPEAGANGSDDRSLQPASGDVAEEDVTFVLETDHDVDTVYARIRRAFEFQTLDEQDPASPGVIVSVIYPSVLQGERIICYHLLIRKRRDWE